jgi:hypothetical protein
MLAVTEADAAAIRAVFNEEGELSAAIEVRRRFPGITDDRRRGNACGSSPAGRCSRAQDPAVRRDAVAL